MFQLFPVRSYQVSSCINLLVLHENLRVRDFFGHDEYNKFPFNSLRQPSASIRTVRMETLLQQLIYCIVFVLRLLHFIVLLLAVLALIFLRNLLFSSITAFILRFLAIRFLGSAPACSFFFKLKFY